MLVWPCRVASVTVCSLNEDALGLSVGICTLFVGTEEYQTYPTVPSLSLGSQTQGYSHMVHMHAHSVI
jgi:hypothetical protein